MILHVLVILQYPDWLKDHGSEVSQEDLQRYTKQLEIMNTICGEFERQPEGEQTSQESSDKIMQLMQQVSVCLIPQIFYFNVLVFEPSSQTQFGHTPPYKSCEKSWEKGPIASKYLFEKMC